MFMILFFVIWHKKIISRNYGFGRMTVCVLDNPGDCVLDNPGNFPLLLMKNPRIMNPTKLTHDIPNLMLLVILRNLVLMA